MTVDTCFEQKIVHVVELLTFRLFSGYGGVHTAGQINYLNKYVLQK